MNGEGGGIGDKVKEEEVVVVVREDGEGSSGEDDTEDDQEMDDVGENGDGATRELIIPPTTVF